MTTAQSLVNRPEVDRIARLLGITDDAGLSELAELLALPAADLRQFREQAVAALFDGAPELLDRLARATKLVPASVSAAICEHALGHRLSAAVAGRLEPVRAADIIERLPIAFTAVSCRYLDPRRIEGIVRELDHELITRIALALAENRDYLTMGAFVTHLPETALRQIISRLDDESVLLAGYCVASPERLDPVLALLDDDRLASVIRSASDSGRWPEALTIALLAGDEQRARLASVTARQDEERLDALVRAVEERDLWDALLPLLELLTDPEKERLLALPAFQDSEAKRGS